MQKVLQTINQAGYKMKLNDGMNTQLVLGPYWIFYPVPVIVYLKFMTKLFWHHQGNISLQGKHCLKDISSPHPQVFISLFVLIKVT